MDCGIRVESVADDWREVERAGFDHAAGDLEDHHSAQDLLGPVAPMSADDDLDPHRGSVGHETQFFQCEVRHCGEEPSPVPADLARSAEASIRPDRILQCVVGSEVDDDPLDVVVIGGAMEASHNVGWRARRRKFGRHRSAPFQVSREDSALIRYSFVYLIRRILVSDHAVKRRTYDSADRRRRAAERRARVVEAASVLFASRGFSRTTVLAVATEAGVSSEMIYKTFGGKAGLVRSIWQDALAGIGPDHAEQRSDVLSADSRSGSDVIEGWVRLGLEVAPRAASVLALVRSAAEVDPEAAGLLDEIERGRAERMLHNARALADNGHLRPGLSVEHARDLLLIFSSEYYDRLVSRAGWDVDDYIATMTRTMSAALLRLM